MINESIFYKDSFLVFPQDLIRTIPGLEKNTSFRRPICLFIFILVGLPKCGTLGEKDNTNVTRADFIGLKMFAKKHGPMEIAVLELEPLLTTHILENFAKKSLKMIFFFTTSDLRHQQIVKLLFFSECCLEQQLTFCYI